MKSHLWNHRYWKLGSNNFLLLGIQIRKFIQRPNGWESAIGLEVHAQIDTNSKLFSSSGVKYGAPVNSKVSLFDAAIPGTLPVLNRKCVEACVLTSLALSCQVNEVSFFDRKHYFYADLPAGYQITQQRRAIANNGKLNFLVSYPGERRDPSSRVSRIRQIQLEQDSGKSLHDEEEERSLIDLNRAGVPLMEIVFEPDLKDGEEAGALVKELSLILSTIETCNCKMEEGSLRIDANVSVNRIGEKLGTRTEVKNLGTVRSLVNAIEFEVQRQIEELENGGIITNDTRSYDAQTKGTFQMRDKEVKQDYRFMPEPNLPPLRLNCDPHLVSPSLVNVALLANGMKEFPETKRQRLVTNFALPLQTAIILVNMNGMFEYFESVMKFLPRSSATRLAVILQTQVVEILNQNNLNFAQCPVSPANMGNLIELVEQNKLSLELVKHVLLLLFEGDTRTPSEIVEGDGITTVIEEKAIESICSEILSANPAILSKYKKTKHVKHINKLMGEIRKSGTRKYDMSKVDRCLRNLMDK